MIYGSVCSGIEAASAAWHPLGWSPSFFSEIDAFPRAVLAHRFPEVPLHGDFTTIQAGDYRPIDLLVGGTPCQSFSIAGLRGGLDDDRGNLALEYLRLADRLRPRWLVWENVPGVLSSNGGRDFGSILGGMVQLGYGFAYRVLDAQFFGVAQRRRRVFVVGHLGDWRRAAAVLFERHSLSGHPAPRREKGPSVAALTANGVGTCGADDNQGQAGHLISALDVVPAMTTRTGTGTGRDGMDEYCVAQTLRARDLAKGVDSDCTDTLIAHTLKGEGFDASEDGTGRGTPLVPALAFMSNASGANLSIGDNVSPCLRIGGDGGNAMAAAIGAAVRRLTPLECARLQGFPDDYLDIQYRGKPASDGPKYKALGNSMAVPVMAWIGRRIAEVNTIISLKEAA
jgi:DNA (cytosine-5)-methyltransferase 1